MEAHRLRPQFLARRNQQPRQHAHAVAQQLAVRRLQNVRMGHRAVDADLIPRLDLLVARRAQQAAVDALPGLGADRADGRLQRRFARQPPRLDPREAPRRKRVPQDELQTPVGLPAQMLEQRAARHRLAAQAAAAARRPRSRAEVGGDLSEQLRARVQPRRRPLQIVGDGVVHGLRIEQGCLRVAFFAHSHLRRFGFSNVFIGLRKQRISETPVQSHSLRPFLQYNQCVESFRTRTG